MDEVAKIKEAITTQADSKPQAITKTETNLVFNEFNWLDVPNVKSVYSVAKTMASKMIRLQ